jgi:hypothetical protein
MRFSKVLQFYKIRNYNFTKDNGIVAAIEMKNLFKKCESMFKKVWKVKREIHKLNC